MLEGGSPFHAVDSLASYFDHFILYLMFFITSGAHLTHFRCEDAANSSTCLP